MRHRVDRHARRWAAFVALTTVLGSSIGVPVASAAAPTDLFFSEYIEGATGANAKALEIYNGTGAPINLAGGAYSIDFHTNGSSPPSGTILLTGSVAAGDVFVIANPGSVQPVLLQADQLDPALNFTGNDALVLKKGGVVLDSIGQIGTDPGSGGWGIDPTNTTDNTLRRVGSVTAGDADPGDPYDPAPGWIGFLDGTYDGLGSHALDADPGPGPGGDDSGSVSADVTLVSAQACIELSTTAISFGSLPFAAEDMPATPDVTITNCSTEAGSLLASATNASGTGVTWTLVDNGETCSGALGTDNFRLNLASDDFQDGPQPLATEPDSLQTLDPDESTTHTARIWTPCPGSSGDGQTLSLQINYLATVED